MKKEEIALYIESVIASLNSCLEDLRANHATICNAPGMPKLLEKALDVARMHISSGLGSLKVAETVINRSDIYRSIEGN